MKRTLFYFLLLMVLPLNAQIQISDTIFIAEVRVRGKHLHDKSIGSKVFEIDSVMGVDNNICSLADLIGDNSSIYIKSYGSGGLATASLRGTGAGHTGIAWNDIKLDNPMLGQSDMALLPAGVIDNFSILYGGNSLNTGNGNIGGLVELSTMPYWNKHHDLFLSSSFGSFGQRSVLAKARTGNDVFQSSTKVYYRKAENDFPYLNTVSGPVPRTETRENSEFNLKGFIQEFYFRKSKSNFSARIWYQNASRNLPVPITSPTEYPPEKQNDESLRAMFEYDHDGNRTSFSLTAAYINDRLHYTNILASVNSQNASQRLVVKSSIRNQINDNINIGLFVNNDLAVVRTNNYEVLHDLNILSAGTEAAIYLTDWFSSRFLIKETIRDNKILVPDFFAGFDFKPFSGNDLIIKTSISKNSKIPTLNDMYWSPGGNPRLKDESGFSSEITIDLHKELSGMVKIENDLTIFRNRISELIRWHPGESTFWVADNVDGLIAYGLETNTKATVTGRQFKVILVSGYSHTVAHYSGTESDETEILKKQLIYVPVNQLYIVARAEVKHFFSSVRMNLTGRRFVTVDNNQYLPPYIITDTEAGIRLTSGKTLYDFKFVIENLFGTDYQNIAYYPMPGRNYLISLIFQFKN